MSRDPITFPDKSRRLVSLVVMQTRETGVSRVATAYTGLAARLALTPAALVGFFTIAWVAREAHIPIAVCVMKQFLGVPCPGCGITRSIAALLAGNPSKAIECNAAGPFVMTFLLFQLALVVAAAVGAAPDQSILRSARLSDRMLLVLMLGVWSKRIFT